jgi:hypothetical protein
VEPPPPGVSRRESPREKQQTQFYGTYHCEEPITEIHSAAQLPPVGDDDVCFLCQQQWASAAEYRRLLGQQQDACKSARNADSLPDNEREQIMLECAQCARLFHMVCVDLYEVPHDDWECRFCQHASAMGIGVGH